jgi:hypothetical protein
MLRYALTIFLSAFLLFQVQPLIGRYILPWFGGTPAVWTSCMLFFQSALLGGYAYAHWTTNFLRPRAQAGLHLLLLTLSMISLPITPDTSWKPVGSEMPVGRILLLLTATIGAPYFLLSSTGPLMQGWFAQTHPNKSPYRLYALSNVGSLLALITYPFAFEPFLALQTQGMMWSWGYLAFALCAGWCAWKQMPRAVSAQERFTAEPTGERPLQVTEILPSNGTAEKRPGIESLILWLALSACGSVVFLATTNQLCQEISVVPALLVLPLALYLLSFVICFDNERWYHRGVFALMLIGSVIWATFVLSHGVEESFWAQLAAYPLAMFACVMCCHGELVRSKPHPRYLTLFFLTISVGGALGGMIVALAAPYFFLSNWEYHLGLIGTGLLLSYSMFRYPSPRPVLNANEWGWVVLATIWMAVAGVLFTQAREEVTECKFITRNFYGVLKVKENDSTNTLVHGRIMHGFQFRDDERRHWPTSYYGPNSGISIAMSFHPRRQTGIPLRVGVVGLGTGTIAALAKEGDSMRFYEINPAVLALSDPEFRFLKNGTATPPDNGQGGDRFFTYLTDSNAAIEVVLGDARVQMEHELAAHDSQQFDVLAIDAFSSDSIPMHLLTKECVEVYFKQLKSGHRFRPRRSRPHPCLAVYFKHLRSGHSFLPRRARPHPCVAVYFKRKPRRDGVLALHISNRVVNLRGICRGLAKEFNTTCLLIDSDDDDDVGESGATWVLLTRNKDFFMTPEVEQATTPWDEDDPGPLLWTDDFCSILQLPIIWGPPPEWWTDLWKKPK